MPTFSFGSTIIDYEIERRTSLRNEIVLTVDGGQVIAAAPTEIPEEDIDATIRKKAVWILDKLRLHTEQRSWESGRQYVSGESFVYLGRRYRLKVVPDDVTKGIVTLTRGWLEAKIPCNAKEPADEVRAALISWYMDRARARIPERVQLYSQKLGFKPTSVVIKDQKKRWGSCTKSGTLNFNWRIIMAPLTVLDYVIVHELAHITVHDHSTDFWHTVGSVMPDYESKKEWLRIHGATLQV